MQNKFLENTNVDSWIDWNLSENAANMHGEKEWPLLFREVAKRTWTARNRQILQDDGKISDSVLIYTF